MGSRCWGCGEKFGRCYEHAGNCPYDCTFGRHDCSGDMTGTALPEPAASSTLVYTSETPA